MFDVGWPELLVIAIVLIVVVGPKDLPKMLRAFGKTTTQMRKMAGDFRRQFDDALREAELDEVRDLAKSVKSMNPVADIKKELNPLKKIGDEITSDLNKASKVEMPKEAPKVDVPPKAEPAAPKPEEASAKSTATAKQASEAKPAKAKGEGAA